MRTRLGVQCAVCGRVVLGRASIIIGREALLSCCCCCCCCCYYYCCHCWQLLFGSVAAPCCRLLLVANSAGGCWLLAAGCWLLPRPICGPSDASSHHVLPSIPPSIDLILLIDSTSRLLSGPLACKAMETFWLPSLSSCQLVIASTLPVHDTFTRGRR